MPSEVPQWLVQSFVRSVQAAGSEEPKERIAEVCRDLIKRWSTSDRRFHGIAHLIYVLTRLETLLPEAREPDLVRLSAWYHGVCFSTAEVDAYTRNGGENEEKSAGVAFDQLTELGVPEEKARRVAILIRAMGAKSSHAGQPLSSDTAVFQAFDLDEQTLRDAHLATLATEPQRYKNYIKRVAEEYSHIPWLDFLRARRQIVIKLLSRKQLFVTPLAREWDDPARENLAAELERLNKALATADREESMGSHPAGGAEHEPAPAASGATASAGTAAGGVSVGTVAGDVESGAARIGTGETAGVGPSAAGTEDAKARAAGADKAARQETTERVAGQQGAGNRVAGQQEAGNRVNGRQGAGNRAASAQTPVHQGAGQQGAGNRVASGQTSVHQGTGPENTFDSFGTQNEPGSSQEPGDGRLKDRGESASDKGPVSAQTVETSEDARVGAGKEPGSEEEPRAAAADTAEHHVDEVGDHLADERETERQSREDSLPEADISEESTLEEDPLPSAEPDMPVIKRDSAETVSSLESCVDKVDPGSKPIEPTTPEQARRARREQIAEEMRQRIEDRHKAADTIRMARMSETSGQKETPPATGNDQDAPSQASPHRVSAWERVMKESEPEDNQRSEEPEGEGSPVEPESPTHGIEREPDI